MQNNETIGEKKRHGCLSVYLILMIIGSSFSALGNFAAGSLDVALDPLSTFPSWVYPILGIFSLINIVSSFAIYKWEKWGFWLFTLTAFLTLCLNFYAGVGIIPSLIGVTGVVILYGVLHIGGDKNGWTQLD